MQDASDPRILKMFVTRGQFSNKFDISSITKGSPTVITALGHTIQIGDLVHLAVTGFASLNNKDFKVTAVTHPITDEDNVTTGADTFTVDVDTSTETVFTGFPVVSVYLVTNHSDILSKHDQAVLRASPTKEMVDDITQPYIEKLLPILMQQDIDEAVRKAAEDVPFVVDEMRDISGRFSVLIGLVVLSASILGFATYNIILPAKAKAPTREYTCRGFKASNRTTEEAQALAQKAYENGATYLDKNGDHIACNELLPKK